MKEKNDLYVCTNKIIIILSKISSRLLLQGTMKDTKFSKKLTVEEFDGFYYYAKELRTYATLLGFGQVNVRKDILETQVREYLGGGTLPKAIRKKKKGKKDSETGALRLNRKVKNFTFDRKTRGWLERKLKSRGCATKKSGECYWLARYLENETDITYGDVVAKLEEMRNQEGRLPRIPSTKMNNFITDFTTANPGVKRAEVMKAWEALKKMKIPKTYDAYMKHNKSTEK